MLHIWPTARLVIYSFLPSILICICNAAIITKLIKQRSVMSMQNGILAANQRRITHSLLAISVCYVLLSLPFCIINALTRKNPQKNELYYLITVAMTILNHSVNFYLFLITSLTFRRGVAQLLMRRKTDEESIQIEPLRPGTSGSGSTNKDT